MMHESGGALVCGSVRYTSSVAILFFSSIGSCSGSVIAAELVPSCRACRPPAILRFFLLGCDCVIDLHARSIAQCSKHFVASGHNFIAFFEPVCNLNVRSAADARRNWYENDFFFVLEKEYPCQLFLGIPFSQSCRLDLGDL